MKFNNLYIIKLFILPVFIIFLFIYIYSYLYNNNIKKNVNIYWKLNLGTKKKKFIAIFILRFFALILLLFSLIDPYYITKSSIKEKTNNNDILFLLDISDSMNTTDIKPSRLFRSISLIQNIIKINFSEYNRFGILLFANKVKLLSPLTTDYKFLLNSLSNINTSLIPDQGTNFIEAFRNTIPVFDYEFNTNKFIIFISDGGEHIDNYLNNILNNIKKLNINVICIGVGSNTHHPIPIYDENMNITNYKIYNGKLVTSKLNYNTIISIANIAQGKHYNLSELNNLKSILDIENNKINKFVKKKKLYPYFVFISLFLFIYELYFIEYEINKNKIK